jgi:hypothetical protein
MDVQVYREGTLVIDLVDAAKMELVWRASAENAVDEDDAPPRAEERLADAVHRMFQVYPPAE